MPGPERSDVPRFRLTAYIFMTDATAPADTAANGQTEPMQGQPAGPGFRIMAQYVRDLSFENPRAPESLRIEGKPAIDMGVEMNASGRPDGATPDESWAFSTGQSALGTPALFPGISYVSASNNRRIHAMTPGAAGGRWPAGWIPPAMNAPSQLGPIYLPATGALGNPAVLLASSDGRVYAFDASSGAPDVALTNCQAAFSAIVFDLI